MPGRHSAEDGPAIAWRIFGIVLIGTFLGPLGGIIVAVALPKIAADFHVSLQAAKWVILVYQVGTTFLLPLIGRIGRRFGESRLFVLGFAVDAIGTLGSGLTPVNMYWLLLLTRVLQAIGSALLFALFSSLVARVVPPAKRGLAFGLAGATVALSLVIAPPLGGILCAYLGWRWVFFIQLPLHVLGIVRGWAVLPRDPIAPAEPLPVASMGLWLLMVASLQTWAEASSSGAKTWLAWGAAAVLLSAAVAFAMVERRARPLFHYSLFGIPAYWLGALGVLVMNLTISVMILLLPFYFEDYLHFGVEKAGLMLGLCPLLTLVAAPLAGQLADRIGARWPAVAGFAAAAFAFSLIAGPGFHGSLPLLGLGLGLLGVAGGLFNSPIIAAMMSSVSDEVRPYASSFNSLARNIGFMLGTTLGALWLSQFLGRYGGPGLSAAMHAADLGRAIGLDAFRYAAGATFWVCAGACAALTIVMLTYPARPCGLAGLGVEPPAAS